MHELFTQVLSKKDLSKAGDLFSVSDDAIVNDLTQVIELISEITSHSDYVNNDNDQSVVEICITRVTAAIRETGTMETHADALVQLLQSCLNHSLRPAANDVDPPHAKIAADIISCIFLNYDKKEVMKKALPVAVKFLHKGNKELSRNMSSYLSLAAIGNAELLSQHIQLIIDSIISGNYTLSRVLPQVYGVDKEALEDHAMALVSLLPQCEDQEKLALLSLFALMASNKPSLLEPSLHQLCEYLNQSATAMAAMQVFLNMAEKRPQSLIDHLPSIKASADRYPNMLCMAAKVISSVGKLNKDRAQEALNFVLEHLPNADRGSQSTLLREATLLCSSYPVLFTEKMLAGVRQVGNANNTISTTTRPSLDRHPRSSAAGGTNKPMNCKKLHGTEDTPFIAIILNRASGRLICMGSIIDEKHVLTAYRCVQNTDSDSIRILVGYFKAYWGRHSQVLYVDKMLKHEHDLVILRTQRAMEFSRTVKPIQILRLADGQAAAAPPVQRLQENALFEEENNFNDNNEREKLKNELDTDTQMLENEAKENNSKIAVEPLYEEYDNEELDNISINKSISDGTIVKNVSQLQSESKVSASTRKSVVGPGKKIDQRVVHGMELGFRQNTPPAPETLDPFQTTHPDIKEFLLVGFPLSSLDAVGDAISKTLVYTMKEEKLSGTQGEDCLKLYQEKPALDDTDDPTAKDRVFCTDGSSKLCWGCLGGPTLYKKEQDYIQVGVVGGANCDKQVDYQHIRVDINEKWISANSLIGHKN